MKPVDIFLLIMQINASFKIIHDSGLTYNNLSLYNIMLSKQENSEQSKVYLIDYSETFPYLSHQGHFHLTLKEQLQDGMPLRSRKTDML